MLVHQVRFYLPADLTTERRAALRAGLETLRGIPTVRQLHIGTPAPVPARPVIDTEYAFALTVLFADLAGPDVNQTHPLHLQFLAAHKTSWTRVAVVDAA